MRFAPRFGPRTGLLLLTVGLMLSGCAYAVPEVDPADIPRLRRDVTANPEDTDLQVQLGMAQFKAEDYDQALQNLQAAVDAGNESGVAFLYLGMTHEQSDNWSGARDAYSRYLEVGRSDPLKQEITGRLELIGANILRDQARAALAAEAGLGAVEAAQATGADYPCAFTWRGAV